MSLIGKNTLSFRKKDVLEQKLGGSPHKRLVWAHKATAGETGINLTALTTPTEMSALGFTNPNTSELLAGKMLFYKKNLTVTSSSKGILMQDLSYTVPTNERIAFQGFTADEDEIFTCTLESEVKDGYQVIDATSIVSTGTLAGGATTFNVGVPFQIGKYISQQAGSVLVYLDGIQQFRNTNNSGVGLDANYYEVDAGGGLGSIIEFNASDPGDRSVLVVSNGMVAERPNGSTMAVVESLAGQIDLIIPTVADLAGVPTTNFQGAPNNVDLKNFGDRVYINEQDIIALLADQERVAANYWQSAASTAYGAGAQLNFDSVNYDTHSAVTTGAGVWKFTCPTGKGGLYVISGSVNFLGSAQIMLYKNGSAYKVLGFDSAAVDSSYSGVVDLVPGDFFSIRPVSAVSATGAAGQASSVTNIDIARISK